MIGSALALRGCILAWLAFGLAMAGPARAETRAVVIGVSTYASLPPLPGAVGDADDIRNALLSRGIADIVYLVDAAARRAALEEAVKAAISKSRSGDTLILTFAGHGSLLPDTSKARAGKAFLLSGYSADGSSSELFRDEDLRSWSRDLDARGAYLVAVLDACHSGVGLRKLPPAGQPLTPMRFVSSPMGVDLSALGAPEPIVARNSYVFGATDSALRVNEVLIDGASRGALSFAFARAVEGTAATLRNGAIRAGDMRTFLSQAVRNISQNSQTPQFHIPEPGRVILQPMRPAHPESLTKRFLSISAMGGRNSALHLSGSRFKVLSEGLADLVWDPNAHQLRNIFGDALAYNVGEAGLEPAAEAHWAYRQLSRMAAEGEPLATRMHPEGVVLCEGTRITLTIGETRFPYVILFNLSGDGTVQSAFSGRYGEGGQRTGEGWAKQFNVAEPFGADYFIVIATESPLVQLERTVEALDEKIAPSALYEAVSTALQGRQYAMAVHERYSADEKRNPELCQWKAERKG